MPSLLDQLEDAIVNEARAIDATGGADAALRLADWVIVELREGTYRLDPDPGPGDDVEYQIHARQPNGVRLATQVTVAELDGLDDDQRIQSIGLKAIGLMTLMEARKGHGHQVGPPPTQSIAETAAGFDPDEFDRQHPVIDPDAEQ